MSTNQLINTKSILAKLLAGENITVAHKSGISTAAFDLQTRTMYLPVWADMDGYMYDMLVGHENGHALYTPPEGWHNAIDEHGRGFKSCMNVIEDARIEKLIKRKYPGLAKSFNNAYRDLFDRDFFGIKRLNDLNKLNLIDRINIHCKVGAHIIVPFTDEEKVILREVEKAETWSQVMDISKRVYDYAKKEDQNKINDLEDLTEQLMKEFGVPEEDMEQVPIDFDDFDFDMDDDESESAPGGESESDDESESGESEESEESDEEESKSGDSIETDSEDDESDSGDKETGKAGGTNEDDSEITEDLNSDVEDKDEDNEPESVTDRIFRSREQELCVSNVEYFSYNLPEPILNNIIVPASAIVKQFFIAYDDANKNNLPIAKSCLKRFNDTNGSFINMMVKEFEMRKNASQYARQQTARTGELDMSKLHLYKFSNDLFKKVTVVPKGKSHGLIMYIDMSGSMSDVFGPTIEQALILAVFCKKVGIPFDVYGFSDSHSNIHAMIQDGTLRRNFGLGGKFRKFGQDNYTINERGFHLRHMIGSDLNNTLFRKAMEMMAVVAYNHGRNRGKYALGYSFSWTRAGFELHATPFTQTTLASRPMIESFRETNKLDIVNVIYLTDGYGGNCFKFDKVPANTYSYGDKKDRKVYKIIMTDVKTRQRVEFEGSFGNQQQKITQFVQQITGCKHIGYYICSPRECKRELEGYARRGDARDVHNAHKSYKANKYFAVPHLGYHKYFFIAMPSQNVEDDDYEVTEKMTSRRIARVFSNAQDSKRKNRMFISQFAEEIAV